MHVPPMRPTFEIDFPIEPDEAIKRLAVLLDDTDYPISGRIAGNHLMLVIPPADRHFWSPWLNIEVNKLEGNSAAPVGSAVIGRFSPNPSVWTGFMLTYIALSTLSFFAAMFGVAQWMMDKPPSVLKIIPLFVVIGALLYWASLIGQKIANDQMHELYDASMNALTAQPAEPKSTDENRMTSSGVS